MNCPLPGSSEMKAIVTNQSFRDTGGHKVYPDLEMGTTLVREFYSENGRAKAIERALRELAEKAHYAGYSHVFDVEWTLYVRGHPNNDDYSCIIWGTAYKRK